jgi:hypothetical protein
MKLFALLLKVRGKPQFCGMRTPFRGSGQQQECSHCTTSFYLKVFDFAVVNFVNELYARTALRWGLSVSAKN